MTAAVAVRSGSLPKSKTEEYRWNQRARRLAFKRIRNRSGCNTTESRMVLAWCECLLNKARQNRGRIDLSEEQLSSREYQILKMVMPLNTGTEKGQAHRAIEDALLLFRSGELAIAHSSRRVHGKTQLYCLSIVTQID